MKKYLLSEDKSIILDIFKKKTKSFILWQGLGVTPDRMVYESLMQDLDAESLMVTFETIDESEYDFYPGDIFAYDRELRYFFKLAQVEMQANTIMLELPKEVGCLNEKESIKLHKALSELMPNGSRGLRRSARDQDLFEQILTSYDLEQEDMEFKDQRLDPRAKPVQNKIVKIFTRTGIGEFDLYDLSSGGLSIITTRFEEFAEGEEVDIKGFDDKEFDEPLKAKVKNLRDIKDLLGQYKIGMEFFE